MGTGGQQPPAGLRGGEARSAGYGVKRASVRTAAAGGCLWRRVGALPSGIVDRV